MASFASPQRPARKPADLTAAPWTIEMSSPAADPDAQPSLMEPVTRGQNNVATPRPLVPIPVFRPDTKQSAAPALSPTAEGTPHADAPDPAREGVRGMAQGRRAVKQAGSPTAGTRMHAGGALPIQRKNTTGLPDALKAGVEALSGIMLDDVRVRYNSAKAGEMGALAYAHGTEIHVGPGQEEHLAHEAWHTVQQKQGRVKPTMQAKGLPVNDDAALEREADAMGARASAGVRGATGPLTPAIHQAALSAPIQRKIGFEYEMPMLYSALATPVTKEEKKKFAQQVEQVGRGKKVKDDFTGATDVQRRNYLGSGELVDNKTGKDMEGGSAEKMGDFRFHALSKKEKIVRGTGFTLEADEGNALQDGSSYSVTEFVTDAFEEGDAGRKQLVNSLKDLKTITDKIETFAGGKRKVIHAAESAPGGLVGKVIYPTNKFNGVLQVTGAVDLARIPELMKSMNKSEGETEKFGTDKRDARDALGSSLGGALAPAGPTGKAPVGSEKAIQDHKNFAFFDDRDPPANLGSDELHGLVALLASYMMSANNAKIGYAKTIAPIMARTDFAEMFKMIHKEEQKYFKEDPAALVEIVKFATGSLDMTKDVFPHGIYNDPRAEGGGKKDALKGLTRARWVTGIAGGTDYFSAAKFNLNPDIKTDDRSEKKSDLESMGAMGGKTEKVGSAKKEAPLFEIRSLGQLNSPEMMYERALAIFDFLSELNEDKKAEFGK